MYANKKAIAMNELTKNCVGIVDMGLRANEYNAKIDEKIVFTKNNVIKAY